VRTLWLSGVIGILATGAVTALAYESLPSDDQSLDSIFEIERMIALLSSSRFEERVKAERDLVALGAAALPQLEQAAKSRDMEVAKRAKAAIADISRRNRPQAGAAVARLGELPKAPDPRHLDRLVTMLASKNFRQREQAQRDLAALGSVALPRLEQSVTSPDAEVARRAKAAVAEIKRRIQEATGPAVLAGPPEPEELLSADPYARIRAMRQMACLKPPVPARLPEVLRALDDWDDEVRGQAICALCSQRVDPNVALPRIMAIVRSEKERMDVRSSALSALVSFLPQAESAVPDLLALLQRKGCPVRPQVASILGRVGASQPSKVLPTLLDLAMNDADKQVKVRAAVGLARLRKEPQRCVPVIHELLRREQEWLGAEGKRRRTTIEEVTPMLSLLGAIGSFGLKAREAAPTVFAISSDESIGEEVRQVAVSTLGFLGAIDELYTLAEQRQRSPAVRLSTVNVLRKLGVRVD
jgi:HEAT repeat protein